MSRGVIYARVSTEEQAKEGQSIDAQEKLCRRYANENGIVVVDVFKDEGKSGSNTNRPALRSMLDRIGNEKDIECVLVLDTDRLARNTLDHLTLKAFFKKHDCRLISISQPMIDDSPEGKFIDVVLAGANALQSQITGRKTSKVMEEKAKAGYWPGWAPLGYQNVRNDHPTCQFDKNIITPHPTEAELIGRMFDYYATGTFTLQSLTQKMLALGLTSKKTKKLSQSIVNLTLKNPIYYGVIPWKGTIYPGHHTPLTSKPVWKKCQEIMADHNQHASRTRKHDYLLRGYLYCADCSSRFWAAPHKGHTTTKEYYFCKHCKRGTYTDVDTLEKQVIEWIASLEVTDDYAKKLIEKAKTVISEARDSRQSDFQTLTNQKTTLQEKLTKAEDNLLDNTFTKDQYRRVADRIEKEITSIDEQLYKIQRDYSRKFESVKNLVNMARDLKQSYIDADPDLKRHYLNLFFKKLIIKDKEIIEAVPSDDLKPLLKNGQIRVRVKKNWLPVHLLTRTINQLFAIKLPKNYSSNFAIATQ